MREEVRLLAFTAGCILLLLCPKEAWSQTGAVALIEELRGPVLLRRNAAAQPVRLDPRADLARRLYPNEVVSCRRGGFVSIRLGGEVRPINCPGAFTIPRPPAEAARRPNPHRATLDEYGRIAGTPRSAATKPILYSPSDHSGVLPETFSIRWVPFRTSCRASLSVETPGGEVLWRQEGVNVWAGSADACAARQALADFRSKTGAATLLLKIDDGCGNKEQSVFSLLSAERERALAEELAGWDGEPARLLAHLGRAATFLRYDLFPQAAEEYEAALALAPQSRDLLAKAADTHRRTGNAPRADELAGRRRARAR